MNALIAILALIVCGGSIFLAPAEAPGALALCIITSLPTLYLVARRKEDRTFLLRLFILGVLIRIAVGTVIFVGHYEDSLGGNANPSTGMECSWAPLGMEISITSAGTNRLRLQ